MTVNPSSAHDTSHSLIERLQRNEADAWATLLYLYDPLIDRWSRLLGIRSYDLDEIRQETMIVVTRRILDFQHNGRIGAFRAWLCRIVETACLAHRRKNSGVPAEGGTDAAERLQQIPADYADPPEFLFGVYERALKLIRAEFSERDFRVFRRLICDERSVQEVAKEFDLTSVNVRQIKHRILHRLREITGDDSVGVMFRPAE